MRKPLRSDKFPRIMSQSSKGETMADVKKITTQVRTTTEERARWIAAANHYGTTVSAVCREALGKLVRRAEKEQADAADQGK
jgi:hypothetical protein